MRAMRAGIVKHTYTFMQVDCVFAGDDVGDGRSGGSRLLGAGFGFGSHRAGLEGKRDC